MLKVGVSSRVDDVAGYGERRDALDQEWIVLLEKVGILGVPLPNHWAHPKEAVKALGLDGVIFSGGNDIAGLEGATNVAPERDRTERALIEMSLTDGFPILGVCRGMQMLAHHFGATPVRVKREHHVAQRHDLVSSHPLLSREVANSFHGWGFAELPEQLEALAHTRVGNELSIEAFRHRQAPILGVMWHPEREPFDPLDRKLIAEFFLEKTKTQ